MVVICDTETTGRRSRTCYRGLQPRDPSDVDKINTVSGSTSALEQA
jgi:hypothetical protein